MELGAGGVKIWRHWCQFWLELVGSVLLCSHGEVGPVPVAAYYGTKAKIDFIKSLKIDFRVCGHLINVSFMISDTGCTTCMHHISTCAFEGGHFIICEILS
jgi:hypothetical protein